MGKHGEVIGVEISSEVARVARRRIDGNHWNNVQVVVGDARTVALNGKYDGMILFGAPDVYASAEALANLCPYLRDNARVVAFGSKLTTRRFGVVPNMLVKCLMGLSYESTPKLNFEPWAAMKEYCSEIQIREFIYGCFFLVSGAVRRES